MCLAIAKSRHAASEMLLRLVRPDESETVYNVHVSVRRTLPHKSFMYERKPEFFRDIAFASGRLVGAYRDDELIGYAALLLGDKVQTSHWRQLHRLNVPAEQIAEGAGGAILPDYRRRGLYARLLRKRNDVARDLGLQFQTSIVAPGNLASLRSFLGEGFLIAAIYADQDGDNYLMLKSLVAELRFDGGPGHPAALDDMVSNLQFLNSGLCGVPCGHGEALHVRYHRIADRTPAPSDSRAGDVVAR